MAKKGSIREAVERETLEELCREGERIMRECLAEKDYKNQTRNLAASYGWAVYKYGKLYKWNWSGIDIDKSRLKYWYGERIYGPDEIAEYLDPDGGDGGFKPSEHFIELVIAAAMPYGEVLEAGGGNIKRQYRVVAMAYDKLMAIAGKTGGKVVRILRGEKQW